MGSIESYQTAGGRRYRVRYRDPDHRSREKAGFSRKIDAEQFLASTTVTTSRGEWVDPSSAKAEVGALAEEWLASRSNLKPSSLKPLQGSWRKHVAPQWAHRRVGEIRHSEVQNWVATMSKASSPTVVIRAHGVLAGILDIAVRDRRITRNPAREIKLPRKVPKEHVYLTHQQVHDLATASGERGPIILLLCYTGLRWAEMVALRVKDIDFQRRRIRVSENAVEVDGMIEVGTPKSHKRRTVPFPHLLDPALRPLVEGKGPDDLVFADKRGMYLRRTRVSTASRSWFVTARLAAGIPQMTLHDLRHTAASLAVSAGANVKAIQRMLGHASAAMTLDIYADLFDDDLDDVSARLDDAATKSVVGFLWGMGKSEQKKPPESAGFRGFRSAETEGFEPSVPLRGLHLSRVVH